MDMHNSSSSSSSASFSSSSLGSSSSSTAGALPSSVPPNGNEIHLQDRYLPIANLNRIIKTVCPPHAKVTKEAKEAIQEAVSEFISFVTSEASDKCIQEKRKTISGDDLLWAMGTLGFDKYVEPLRLYLVKYREATKDTPTGSGSSKHAHKDKDNDSDDDAPMGPPPPDKSTKKGTMNNNSNNTSGGSHLVASTGNTPSNASMMTTTAPATTGSGRRKEKGI